VFSTTDPTTFWLNFTNIVLGAVTLICVAVVARVVYREVAFMRKRRKVDADDHAFMIPELGFTMADGGERDPAPAKRNSISDGEAPNVIRSVN
jgi:hypothetical protein